MLVLLNIQLFIFNRIIIIKNQSKKRKEQMEKRQKYAHLINVNMDPQLTGKIIHYLISSSPIVESR